MLYEQILELDKNNPTVINELGDLCLKGDETQRAVRYFLSAASKYRTTGLLNNAVAIYKKILRHDDENLNAHWYLSETRANQGLIVEGENHAVHFLDSSENISGDIKEIFLKRCQSLFDLYPQSRVILSRLNQIFRMWSMTLEAARADCLLACMDFSGGKEDEARAAIDELTGKVSEIMNYPEFAKWTALANPDSVEASSFADFGTVTLGDDGADSPTPPEAPAASVPADDSFGDLSLGQEKAPVPAPKQAASTAPVEMPAGIPANSTSPLLENGSPVAQEIDDDGCFSIDDDSADDDSADFNELIAQATAKEHSAAPAAEVLAEPTVPATDDPASALLPNPDTLFVEQPDEEKIDLLAQMLEEDGPELVTESDNEVATISAEIGAVVGGGDGDDADRLYEMGMVYLEMGMFDQACDSFETAAADEKFSVRAHEMWGITLQRADRHEEAIKVLSDGLEFAAAGSREHHGLMYHLGMAKEKTGQTDEAIACFRTINDADPSYLDVGRRLARLTAV